MLADNNEGKGEIIVSVCVSAFVPTCVKAGKTIIICQTAPLGFFLFVILFYFFSNPAVSMR